MTLTAGYELATDAQFKELSNFVTPPRAGRVTALEASGQVRVESDDPDGGDVLAWPLNGFGYAVGDVVYVVFAVNSPDSALVIGSIAPLPSLDVGVLAGDLDLIYGRLAAANTWTQNQTINSTGVTGSSLFVTRNLAAASTNAPVVAIVNDHASDDQVGLYVRQDAPADVVQFAGNGATTLVDQFGNFYTSGANPTAGLTGTGVVSLRIHKSDGSGKDWRVDQNRNTADGSLEFTNVTDYGGANRLRARLYPDGALMLGGLASMGASILGVKAGSSTNDAAVGGVLYVNTTAVGNVGAGEDNLMSYAVAANTLAVNGQSIWMEAAGTVVAGGVVKIYFGATPIFSHTAAATGDFMVKARVIRTGATTQKCYSNIILAGPVYDGAMNYVTAAETLSGAVTVKLTGTGAANNDVVQETFVVGWDDANT